MFSESILAKESILKFKDEVYETQYKDIPVFDCHTHIMHGPEGIQNAMVIKELFNFEWMNVLSIPTWDFAQNLKMMVFKNQFPEKSYIFGGLIHNKEVLDAGYDYATQAKNLIALGFDGMKMLEGKPEIRKELQKPLDDPSFDEYYKFLEEEEVPLLIHVADPEEFWDRETVPEWAYNNGWFWGDGTYTSKEDLYREVDGFLTKFPKIHGIFAHFYFLSADLEKAAAFLDKWENVSIDLTPGTEMFVNLSKNPEKAKEFFLKYQDRILFGTDNFDPGTEEELDIMTKIVSIMRQFLETDDTFQVWDLTFKGIKLDREVLEKIYYKNFFKYVKAEPKELNLEAAVKESKLTIELAKKVLAKDSKMEEMNELLHLLETAAKGEA